MGTRRKAREAALQMLFFWEEESRNTKLSAEQAMHSYWPNLAENRDPEVEEYANALLRGVVTAQEKIDGAIRNASKHWRLERMSKVDRNVLRIAVLEIFDYPETPTNVILNEAVEVAKRYGAENSGSFVNGVLDQIARNLPRGADSKVDRKAGDRG